MADGIDLLIADLDLYIASEIVALVVNVDAELRSNPPAGTPVDTGWARANWVPSLHEPSRLPSDVPDPTPSQVTARAKVAQDGLNDVLSYRLTDGVVFVTNNVPYIQPLNAGHSPQQAQPGFVQRAIAKAVQRTYSAGASKAARDRRTAAGRAGKARPI